MKIFQNVEILEIFGVGGVFPISSSLFLPSLLFLLLLLLVLLLRLLLLRLLLLFCLLYNRGGPALCLRACFDATLLPQSC